MHDVTIPPDLLCVHLCVYERLLLKLKYFMPMQGTAMLIANAEVSLRMSFGIMQLHVHGLLWSGRSGISLIPSLICICNIQPDEVLYSLVCAHDCITLLSINAVTKFINVFSFV